MPKPFFNPQVNSAWEFWLASRPPIIRKLAKKFPPGIHIYKKKGAKPLFVVAYCEDGGIEVSKTDPRVDYPTAVHTRFKICAKCLKNAKRYDCPQPTPHP